MLTGSQKLPAFAAELKFAGIPASIGERAKDSIINTVGISTFGSRMPWSQMIAQYPKRNGSGGKCSLMGMPEARVHPPFAALANGLFAHAFELDSTFEPSIGAHPGASLA